MPYLSIALPAAASRRVCIHRPITYLDTETSLSRLAQSRPTIAPYALACVCEAPRDTVSCLAQIMAAFDAALSKRANLDNPRPARPHRHSLDAAPASQHTRMLSDRHGTMPVPVASTQQPYPMSSGGDASGGAAAPLRMAQSPPKNKSMHGDENSIRDTRLTKL